MGDLSVNQKIVIPLFNTQVQSLLQFKIKESEFIERLTYHAFPRPIPMFPSQKLKFDPSNKPIATSFPPPQTTIYLVPWTNEAKEIKKSKIKQFPLDQVPEDFDLFDNLGSFALRSGSGGGGSFQTATTIETKRRAKSILVIEFIQKYPEALSNKIDSANPYEIRFVDSLLDGIRLYSGREPHQYKSFHLTDNRNINIVNKWPLVEFQGEPLEIGTEQLGDIKAIFMDIWRLRNTVSSNKRISYQTLNLAIDYHYLSSTMTETRTIFLYLMIAFESLFKSPDERSASAASNRLTKLVASNKIERSQINKFMWNRNSAPGCCQIRNKIVHGDIATISTETFWKLRNLIRIAILKLVPLVLTSKLDHTNYYNSLDVYVKKKFEQMPDK